LFSDDIMFKDIAKGPPQAFKTAKQHISLPVLRSDLDAAIMAAT
jgi:hypothetical protein